jgi:hypothetical protein
MAFTPQDAHEIDPKYGFVAYVALSLLGFFLGFVNLLAVEVHSFFPDTAERWIFLIGGLLYAIRAYIAWMRERKGEK